jgi:hypothetical protein
MVVSVVRSLVHLDTVICRRERQAGRMKTLNQQTIQTIILANSRSHNHSHTPRHHASTHRSPRVPRSKFLHPPPTPPTALNFAQFTCAPRHTIPQSNYRAQPSTVIHSTPTSPINLALVPQRCLLQALPNQSNRQRQASHVLAVIVEGLSVIVVLFLVA